MKKETVIKNEWENVWFCNLKDLQTEPKVDGTKITFTTPVRKKLSFILFRKFTFLYAIYICAIYILYNSRYWLIKQKLSSSPLHFHPLSSSLILSYLFYSFSPPLFATLILYHPLLPILILSPPFSFCHPLSPTFILSPPLSFSIILLSHSLSSSSLILYHPLIHFRSSLLYSHSLSSSLIHSDPHSSTLILTHPL